MPAQLKPITARLRHRFPQAARSAERAVLAFLVAGLFWLAMVNVWVEVSLAQESDPVPSQGKPGQVQVCEYDPELEGLLCGEWVDIDTLPEADVPEQNCLYGTYWDGSRYRCRPRCAWEDVPPIGLMYICRKPPKPTCLCGQATWNESKTKWECPARPTKPTCQQGTAGWFPQECKWKCPTPTPTPTPPDQPPPCECGGKATKVNGKWKCPDRPAKPTNCQHGDPTWSNCKWQCPLPPDQPPPCECGGKATKVNGKWKCPDRPKKPTCRNGTATWSNCKWQCPLPPSSTPKLSVTAGSRITEGGTASFTISASPAPSSALTVKATVGQSGDFAASGDIGSKMLKMPTTGSASYSVKTKDDSIDEPDGSITLTLNAGRGYTVHATNNAATVAVADDDDPPALDAPTGLRLTLRNNDLLLTYDRITGAKRHFRFDLYRATADPGDVSGKKIALDDDNYHARDFLSEEGNDKVEFKDLPAGWYYAVGRTCLSDATNATCGSDHALSPVVRLRHAILIAPTRTALAEPNEKSDERDVSFRLVYPGGAPAGGTKVQFTFGGKAVRGTDYSFPGPTITLSAGEREKTLSLRVLSDSLQEADEPLSIAISGIEDDSMGYATKKHELVITDLADPLLLLDDQPKQLVFAAQGPGPHRLRLRLQTSWNRPVVLPDYEFDNRSFTLHAQSYLDGKPAEAAVASISALRTVNASHDSDTAVYEPGDSQVVPASGNLPGYARLGHSHLYWREGDQPYDHRYLEVVLSPRLDAEGNRHDRYRLTFTKPDFAITDPPKLARDAGGNYQMTLSLYNAETYDSRRRDSIAQLLTYCHQGPAAVSNPVTFAFSDLRGSGDQYLLDGHEEKEFSFPVLCPRGAYPTDNGQIFAAAQVTEGQYEGPVLYGAADFKGPDRDDTLWAPQTGTDLSGGLALVTPQSCTLSFILPLQRIGGPPVPAASTTGHCADDDDGNALFGTWQQGTELVKGAKDEVEDKTKGTDSPNSFLGSTELHPLKSPAKPLNSDRAECRVYTAQNKYVIEDDCRRGDQAYATIKRSADLDNYELPAGKDNPYPKQVDASTIARPKKQNKTGEKDLEIGYFKVDSRSFQIVGARPPDPDPYTKEVLHKVGVTTGWTEGSLASGTDKTCPGGKIGTIDNKHDGGYHECRSEASYASMKGDSGAPVFVRVKGSATEVLLVGVHYGGELEGASREFSRFIPIDRIYAETLINGYDWDADWLRPLPRLGDFMDESLTVNRSTGQATAVFDATDFSRSQALVYEVGLYQRKGGQWSPKPIAIDSITYRDRVAEFTGLEIPDQSTGSDYQVKVRMNAKLVTGTASLDKLDHRGGWGPASNIAARMTSYPEKLALRAPADLHKGQSGKITIAAAKLAPESGYRLKIASENQNVAFDEGCSVFQMQADLPEKASSYQKEVEIHGCKPGQLQVEADLARDDLLVAVEAESGNVSKPPEVGISGLTKTIPRGRALELAVSVSGLDPKNSYRLQLSTGKGAGLGAGCTDQTSATDLPAGATSYKGKIKLHACSPGAEQLDAVLSLGGKQLVQKSHAFKVLDQTLTLGDLPESIAAGEVLALSAQVQNLDPKSSYHLSAKADGKIAGFGGGCAATSDDLRFPTASESFGGVLNIKACAVGQAEFTVSLLSGSSVLKSVKGTFKVTPATKSTAAASSGTVVITGLAGAMKVGQSTIFGARADKLSTAHDYSLKVELSGAKIGFDSSCKQTSSEIAIPAGSEKFTSPDLDLHACGGGLAGVTVKLLSAGKTVATHFADVGVYG